MKRLYIITALLIFTSFIMANIIAAEETEKISIRVDGLSCPFCAYGLEKNLKKLEGVEKVDIKVNQGLAEITLKPGKKLEEKALREAVKKAGFTPREIKRETDGKQPQKDLSMLILNVKGMMCSGCVYNVKNALESVPEVEKVMVDLEKGQAHIWFEKGKVSDKDLIEAVEKAGKYKATKEKTE